MSTQGRQSGRNASAPNPGTVLVTGAAGFVGSCVVTRLAASGVDVRAVDVVASPHSEALGRAPNVDFTALDLREHGRLEEVVQGSDVIVHLAAVRTRASGGDRQAAFDINVKAGYDLIALAADHGVRRIVFGSTNTVYGPYRDPTAPPARENQPWPIQGINLYAATKLATEAYLEAFANSGGSDYLSLRIGPVYGPGASEGSNSAMLTDILRDLDRGHEPSVPWTRDSVHAFVHVDDVAEACEAAITTPQGRTAVNVVGAPTTTEDMCARLVELYGRDPSNLRFTGERQRFQFVSQEQMSTVLGFLPRTTITAGLESVIAEHRQRSTTR